MNITADSLAKGRLQQALDLHQRLPTIHALHNTIPPIYYNNFSNNRYADTTIYSHAGKTLKELIAKDRSIKYWSNANKNIQHRYVMYSIPIQDEKCVQVYFFAPPSYIALIPLMPRHTSLF